MNATIRFLRRVAPSAVLSLALGLGSWQVASAQAPPAGPGGPAVAPVGPAIAAPAGPAVGPGIAGPAVGGPAIVDGPIDGPPPGPAMVHHFVHVVRYPRYREMVEYRTELLLFADNTFHMIYPNMGAGWGGRVAADVGPEKIIGAWGMNDDYLAITFEDGFIDYGLLTVGNTGPLLRFAGRRWTDLLAVPGPDAPAGPVGPAVGGPVGPAIAAPVGPAIAAPVGPLPQ